MHPGTPVARARAKGDFAMLIDVFSVGASPRTAAFGAWCDARSDAPSFVPWHHAVSHDPKSARKALNGATSCRGVITAEGAKCAAAAFCIWDDEGF